MAQISYTGGSQAVDSAPSTELNVDTMPADGWITGHSWVFGATSGTVAYRFVLYLGTTRRYLGGSLSAGTSVQERSAGYTVRATQGQTIRWGLGYNDGITRVYDTSVNGHNVNWRGEYPPPDTFSAQQTSADVAVKGTLTYTTNVAPSTPTWRSPAAGATVNNNPTIQGNLLQGSDASLDTIDSYDLQVWVSATGAFVVNTTYNTTSTERSQGYFSRALGTLTPGTNYTMRFRTIDSFGAKSAQWSAERSFTITPASDSPILTSPINDAKLNVLSGYNYVFQHSHPSSLSANGYQILVKNAAGSTLFDSGAVTITSVANGATITVPEFHADLTYNTDYRWQARTRDTNNNFGPYSALGSFHTNKAPDPPTGLAPANNLAVSSPVFTATATDPDGDPIASGQIEIALVSSGATVAGYPAAMVVGSGGVLNYTPPGSGTGSLTLGTAYKWRARANDGLGAGDSAWSEWAFFTYAATPTVAIAAPHPQRVNMIWQPSAEYDPTNLSAFWTTTNAGGVGQSIARTADDSAPYGAWLWRITTDGSGTIDHETTNFINVDGTKSLIATVWARTISGAPALSLQMLAYNSSNTLLATLSPSNIQSMSSTTPPTAWTRYGGLIGQIGAAIGTPLPAGTVKIKLRVRQNATAGVADIDAIGLAQLAYNPADLTARTAMTDWFGYADGDSINFRGVDEDYQWTGIMGDSPSNVLPILTKATAQSLVINYSHTVAKGNDRLIIQKWVRGEWVDVHDSNPTWSVSNGARTTIPMPTNVVSNEDTFRLKVQVRDTSAVQGESAWVTFDVFYTGPAQLDIQIAEAQPWAARVYLAWNQSALGVVFAGAEIQRVDPTGEEDPAIIGIVTNVNTTEFYDHYPQSGKLYTYRVRQREQVGADQTTSFWSSVQVQCDYAPYVFLKDTEDPDLFTAYDTAAENLVGYEEEAPVGIISPWGAQRPTVLTRSKLRIRTGEVTAAFFTDAGIEIPGFLDRDTLWERAKLILKRRNMVCILTTQPDPAKLFAAIVGPARATYPYPPNVKGVEFPWQEVSYSEDVYDQNGII